MTNLDYYACRAPIPDAWNPSSATPASVYNMPESPQTRAARGQMPVRMRSETLRWCGSSAQQPSQQQQPKILYNLLMQSETRNDAVQTQQQFAAGYGTSNSHQLMPLDASSHQFCGCYTGDFLVPVGRPRSRSMGAAGWRMPDAVSSSGQATAASRTPSRDSLASYDESVASDEGAVRWGGGGAGVAGRADLLLEDARSKLMTLSTGSDGLAGHYDDPDDVDTRSLSQPGSPHTPVHAFRKYSEGSQLRSRFQHLRSGYRSAIHGSSGGFSDHPVDLSCKRKKFECTPGLPYSRRATISHHVTSDVSLDEGIDDDISSDGSILKSLLTGRVRSNSMSVCGNRGPNPPVGDLGDLAAGRLHPRQRVTLAKKNLLPVKARISDLLNKSVEFACQLQCFNVLPLADQRSLLVNAAPRLLLLEMARSNVQFAVTAVHGSGSQLAEEGEMSAVPAGDPGMVKDPVTQSSSSSTTSQDAAVELPTQQFVESVQNFVRKCQSFGISTEEYFYMRMIALFQLGR